MMLWKLQSIFICLLLVNCSALTFKTNKKTAQSSAADNQAQQVGGDVFQVDGRAFSVGTSLNEAATPSTLDSHPSASSIDAAKVYTFGAADVNLTYYSLLPKDGLLSGTLTITPLYNPDAAVVIDVTEKLPGTHTYKSPKADWQPGVYQASFTVEDTEGVRQTLVDYFIVAPTLALLSSSTNTPKVNEDSTFNYVVAAGADVVSLTLVDPDGSRTAIGPFTDVQAGSGTFIAKPTKAGEYMIEGIATKNGVDSNTDSLTFTVGLGYQAHLDDVMQLCSNATDVKSGTINFELPALQGCKFGENGNLSQAATGYKRLTAAERTANAVNLSTTADGKKIVICDIEQIKSDNDVYQNDQVAFALNDILFASSVKGFTNLLDQPAGTDFYLLNKTKILGGEPGYDINGIANPPNYCYGLTTETDCDSIPNRLAWSTIDLHLKSSAVQKMSAYYAMVGSSNTLTLSALAFGEDNPTKDCTLKDRNDLTPSKINVKLVYKYVLQ